MKVLHLYKTLCTWFLWCRNPYIYPLSHINRMCNGKLFLCSTIFRPRILFALFFYFLISKQTCTININYGWLRFLSLSLYIYDNNGLKSINTTTLSQSFIIGNNSLFGNVISFNSLIKLDWNNFLMWNLLLF